jgi:SurA-like protein
MMCVLASCSGRPPAAPATAKKPDAGRPPAHAVPAEPPAPPADLPPTTVVARVDGTAIELRLVNRRISGEVRGRIDATSDPVQRARRLRAAQLQTLDELIEDRLLFAEAGRRRVEVSDAEVDAAVQAIIKANSLTPAQFDASLAEAGYTMPEYREEVSFQIAVQRVVNISRSPGEETAAARARLLGDLRAKASIVVDLQELPGPAPATVLDASRLLGEGDIQKLLGGGGPFTVKALAGEPATDSFASRHFQAAGKTERHDLAFRVWKLAPAAARDQFASLGADLPGSRVVNQVGDGSLEARSDDIMGHAFIDKAKGAVVLLTCGIDLCHTPADVLAIARLLHDRLDRLGTAPEP